MSQNKRLLRRRKEHREIYEMIAEADVTLQVLDARFPQKCRSKTLEQFAKSKNKQLICCINKADLIPHEVAEQWKKIISKEIPTVFLSALDRQGTTFIRQQIRRFSSHKETLVCVVGYPNVGKSSLINVLRGKKSAPTSPLAGYTRHLRQVKITSTLRLIDTPGISPSDNLSTEEEVFLGTISPEDITNPDLVCTFIIERFKEQKLEKELENYLGTNITGTTDEILEFLAKKRGLISKNAEPKPDEAARILIRDFMAGKILYYEKPPSKKSHQPEKLEPEAEEPSNAQDEN